MIQELSSKVAKWLEQEGAISGKDNGLFSYAVYSLLFGLLPIFIVTLLGLAFGMLREGLLMITPFMLIRKFSGGYHLNSPRICVLLSCICIVFALLGIKVIYLTGKTDVLSLAVLSSVSILSICSPVDNDARKLSKKEHATFGVIVRLFSIAMLISYLLLRFFAPINYSVSFGVGITLPALLQVPCVLNKLVDHLMNKS